MLLSLVTQKIVVAFVTLNFHGRSDGARPGWRRCWTGDHSIVRADIAPVGLFLSVRDHVRLEESQRGKGTCA
ncbi:hypothetical protein BC939DRAFT_452149 [Gamsiella multidivaricata]|uniref:uncharacterized protein n=1 Tax=Gamsiella multidivaricata TaxID=101098 RepID=UPI00221EDA1A|nr:uncharacterized protein BC939DRAFT_452149 [Gamsiella multidivaricata]KAI7823213.1 hypothetical protein BC939DRAFT_452149 [Gamsiella multidivaricata]